MAVTDLWKNVEHAVITFLSVGGVGVGGGEVGGGVEQRPHAQSLLLRY